MALYSVINLTDLSSLDRSASKAYCSDYMVILPMNIAKQRNY